MICDANVILRYIFKIFIWPHSKHNQNFLVLNIFSEQFGQIMVCHSSIEISFVYNPIGKARTMKVISEDAKLFTAELMITDEQIRSEMRVTRFSWNTIDELCINPSLHYHSCYFTNSATAEVTTSRCI